MLQYSPVGTLMRTYGLEIKFYSKIANFHFVDMKYVFIQQLPIFYFFDIKSFRIFYLNFCYFVVLNSVKCN